MMRSLMTAVSGLENHQTRMDVIGNNIANVNTTGFKASRVNFADTLSQTLMGATMPNGNVGGTNPQQVGLGMQIASIDTEFTHGSVSSTGKNTDLAIDMDRGLFVVKNGDQTYYTRNGDFSLDADGNLVMNGSGLHVQGWNGVNGKVSTNGMVQNLHIDMGATMPPQATTQVNFVNNLSSSDALKKIANITLTVQPTTGDPKQVQVPTDNTSSFSIGSQATIGSVTGNVTDITLTFDDGTTASGVFGHPGGYKIGGKTFPSHTSMVTTYDSLGNKHAIPVYFERISDGTNLVNTAGTIPIPPAGAGGAAGAKTTTNQWLVSVAPGVFDGAKIVNGAKTTLQFDGTTGKITSMPALTASIQAPYPDGANEATQVSFNFNGMTQYESPTNANVGSENGYAPGNYKDMSIGQDGVITASYDNGQRQAVGQLAIATFNNAAGLTKEGGSLYSASNNSGIPKVGTFAAQGVSVTPGALEMSNVDVARQFSDMIVTQRGFQANSKIITVSDEMLETLMNMKRS